MIKELIKKRLLFSLVTFILVFGSTALITFAWFRQQEEQGIIISTGDFLVELNVFFGVTKVGPLSPYYDEDKKAVIVNAYDPNSPNYVGHMSVNITVRPIIAARVRMKVLDEWELTRYYIDETGINPIPPIKETVVHDPLGYPYLPYSILSFDNRFMGLTTDDGFIYIEDVMPSGVTTTIYLINGGLNFPVRNNPVFYEECFIYFDIYLDIVQANRAFEIWGIEPNLFG